ncbi:LacI family DNA-binding transcriptional regulator [Paradesertivirga mongoliensis]|uniref:LacI family DNA-binding transcriptional regulator n=1 Tax=Paradesertivirga mongoliensis TaxID=2100740 RepID=A0ABW4ZJN9_9SPHI|nr:LacI family DNA-binding transcriptional regulator [Pedobacter mongoliensis]
MKKPTILDIAKELNITFSTVARALNDHPAISLATKKAVRETAARLNYRQNKIASSLRSGRSNIVGVIVPNLHVSFFSSVVSGIENVMNANGYNILLYQSNESNKHEAKGIETFLQSRVDGIISSVTTETSNEAYREIRSRNIPLMFFDRELADLNVSSVVIDDYKGGFIATEHLIKQGYKNILHITAHQEIAIFKNRLRGYLDALTHYNLPVNEELIIKGDFSLEFGKSVVTEAKLQGKKYDAIFALEDYTAMGAMQALKEEGIKIPQEVGIIGFANEAFGSLVSPALSTIDQQTAKMGEETARIFLNEIRNNSKAFSPEQLILEPILIVRESSSRINA